jgi:hypothetical protein
MRENRTSGSVRGAPGNGRSYREMLLTHDMFLSFNLNKAFTNDKDCF